MPRCHHLVCADIGKGDRGFDRHGHHAASFAPVMRAVTSSGLVSRIGLSALFSPRRMHDDAIADREDVGHAMRNQHDGNALFLEAVDQAQHLLDLPDRDRGGRLVHHDELGVGQSRPRDGDRLALTARHLLHEMLRPRLGTQLAEQLERARRHRLVIKQATSGPNLRLSSRPRNTLAAAVRLSASARSW